MSEDIKFESILESIFDHYASGEDPEAEKIIEDCCCGLNAIDRYIRIRSIASYLADEGDFDHSSNLYNTVLVASEYEGSREILADAKYRLFRIHVKFRQFGKALEYGNWLSMNPDDLNFNTADVDYFFSNMAECCFAVNDNANALKYAELYSGFVLTDFKDDPWHQGYSHHLLGYAFLRNEMPEKAIINLRKGLDYHKDSGEKMGPGQAYDMFLMAEAYMHMEDYEESIRLCRESLQICEGVLPENDSLFARNNNLISYCDRMLGNKNKVPKDILSILEIKEKELPPDHPGLLEEYDALIHAYAELEDFAAAADYVRKALSIRLNAPEEYQIGLVDFYYYAANLFSHVGDMKGAVGVYRHIISVLEKSKPSSRELEIAYTETAIAMGRVYMYAEALKLKEKAMDIAERIEPEGSIGLANMYDNLGNGYCDNRQYEKGVEYHMKALAIYEKVEPPPYRDLASACMNTAMGVECLHDYEKTLEYYERAESYSKKVEPPDVAFLATLYDNKGTCLAHLSRFDDAYACHLLGLSMYRTLGPRALPDIAKAEWNAGIAVLSIRQYAVALAHFLNSLKILEQNGIQNSHYYDTCICIAVAYAGVFDPSSAKDYLSKAYRNLPDEEEFDRNGYLRASCSEFGGEMTPVLLELADFVIGENAPEN